MSFFADQLPPFLQSLNEDKNSEAMTSKLFLPLTLCSINATSAESPSVSQSTHIALTPCLLLSTISGGNSNILLDIRRYDPKVVCLGPGSSNRKPIQPIIDGIPSPASSDVWSFGPASLRPSPAIITPYRIAPYGSLSDRMCYLSPSMLDLSPLPLVLKCLLTPAQSPV